MCVFFSIGETIEHLHFMLCLNMRFKSFLQFWVMTKCFFSFFCFGCDLLQMTMRSVEHGAKGAVLRWGNVATQRRRKRFTNCNGIIHVAFGKTKANKGKQRQTKANKGKQRQLIWDKKCATYPLHLMWLMLWFRDFVETLRGQGVLHVASSKALEKSGGGLYDDTARALANVHPVPAL